MHHKRRRPKNRRDGCLLCKPHKANGAKGSWGSRTMQDRKSTEAMRWEIARTFVLDGRTYVADELDLAPSTFFDNLGV